MVPINKVSTRILSVGMVTVLLRVLVEKYQDDAHRGCAAVQTVRDLTVGEILHEQTFKTPLLTENREAHNCGWVRVVSARGYYAFGYRLYIYGVTTSKLC